MRITLDKESLVARLPEIAEAIKDGRTYDLDIKVHREKRSLSANDYLWVLCTDLAKVLHISKEEVYRKHIKMVGVCEFVAVPDRAYERLVEVWGKQGIGWFCELVDNCKLQGCKKVCMYYGSSTYDTEEMARLIDNVIEDCKEQGVETEPQNKIDELIERWGK